VLVVFLTQFMLSDLTPSWVCAFCCSYILQDGKLRPIPASRGDIFKDKGLSLKDKRSLMTFLATCMEAVDGKGPLAVGGLAAEAGGAASQLVFIKLLMQQP
jgi:hypothetical protein